MKVYQAICAITEDLSKIGISKDRKNQQQGYSFRGIDDVYCALSPQLAKHKLCILPQVVEHSVIERQTARGGALFYTTVKVLFEFVSAEDGSKHTVVTIGEAMDSADKSSNKAMSAAYKYAAFQAFCIPTESDNDADATTHEVAPKVVEKSVIDMDDATLKLCEASTLDDLKAIFSALWKVATPAEKVRLKPVYDERKAAFGAK